MVEHGGTTAEDEQGGARDNGGDYVAMGHVVTGVAAGLNRDEETDLTSGFMESAGGLVGVGEYVDNLYASTIAGDLGQSATIINNEENVTAETLMIGDNTEAMTAELFGDVDGFNIGHAQTDNEEHEPFSTLLEHYYNSVEEDETENRFQYFQDNGQADLQDQTVRFASNYTYRENGKWGGLFSEIGTESGFAVDQFNDWTEDQMETASEPATFDRADGQLVEASGIWLVGDPNDYEGTQRELLEGGIAIKILEEGEGEHFNAEVIEQDTYGWTRVMIMEGPNEGAMGWVSNNYIQ